MHIRQHPWFLGLCPTYLCQCLSFLCIYFYFNLVPSLTDKAEQPHFSCDLQRTIAVFLAQSFRGQHFFLLFCFLELKAMGSVLTLTNPTLMCTNELFRVFGVYYLQSICFLSTSLIKFLMKCFIVCLFLFIAKNNGLTDSLLSHTKGARRRLQHIKEL